MRSRARMQNRSKLRIAIKGKKNKSHQPLLYIEAVKNGSPRIMA
jgi:hypothetical protein